MCTKSENIKIIEIDESKTEIELKDGKAVIIMFVKIQCELDVEFSHQTEL